MTDTSIVDLKDKKLKAWSDYHRAISEATKQKDIEILNKYHAAYIEARNQYQEALDEAIDNNK